MWLSGGRSRGNQPRPAEATRQQLQVVTVNGSCWSTCLQAAKASSAWVVLCQEVKRVSEEDVAEASQQARKAGFKSLWAPGWLGDKGGHCGGACILVRAELGLRPPPSGEVCWPGRAVAGIVDVAGLSFLFVSLYLEVCTGMGKMNTAVLAAAGTVACKTGLPWIMGGDFNMGSGRVVDSAFAAKAGGVVWKPPRATCITKKAATVIDFFVLDQTTSLAVKKIEVVTETEVSPHRPVRLVLEARLRQMTKLVFDQPQRLPTRRVIGPRAGPPVDWSPVLAAAAVVESMTETADLGPLDAALESFYALFADTMEEEIAGLTDTVIRKKGKRSQLPRLIEKPVFSADRERPRDVWATSARFCRWLHNRCSEILAAVRETRSEADLAQLGERLSYIADEVQQHKPDHAGWFAAAEALGSRLEVVLAAAQRDALLGEQAPIVWEHAESLLLDLGEDIRRAADEEERVAKLDFGDKWKSWAEEACSGSAKAAHAYSRLPKEWRPTQVRHRAATSSCPRAVLEVECDRLHDLWGCADQPPQADTSYKEPLQRVSPDRSRRAAASFAESSAVAADGWHLRHYSWLPDDALRALSTFFWSAEARGLFPRQQRLLQIFLTEKPKGGHRSLGLFCSLYRLWTRIRRPEAKLWEIRNQRQYIIFGPGGSAVEAVWRQSLRAELAAARGLVSASLAWDLKEYYEYIDRADLAKRGKQQEFPEVLTRGSVNMYGAARVVTLDGAARRVGFAIRGVVAGCGFATVHIQYYSSPSLDKFVAKHTMVQLQVYIDDFLMQCVAASNSLVHRFLMAAARELCHLIEFELGCSLHTGKAGAIASNKALLTLLRRSLGPLAGSGGSSVVNLGVSVASGL